MGNDILDEKLAIIAEQIADQLSDAEISLTEQIAGFKAVSGYWALKKRITAKDQKSINAFDSYSAAVAEAQGDSDDVETEDSE
jgi:hypothetical protein